MARLDTITHRTRSLIGPLLSAAVLAYIGFPSIQGERGFLTWLKLSNQIEQTRLVLDESRAEESRLERRVALLRRDNLDPDMLDERARLVLNLAAPGELVIYIDRPGVVR